MKKNLFSYLSQLEAESIFIIREAFSEFENPVMLYSIGKDSSVMLHLAKKAFYPGKIPFPLLHVDTGWKFKEMYEFRDQIVKETNAELIVYTNSEGEKLKIDPFVHGSDKFTNIMKTEALKKAMKKYNVDAAFGGARRDEERSRSKERVYSFRDQLHQWDPKKQRPELWNIYNGQINVLESMRIFPLSNWTELDVWEYIFLEEIKVVPLYFSKKRPILNRNGKLLMVEDDRLKIQSTEKITFENVRFRTLGCWPFTSAIKSNAKNVFDIINEMIVVKTSERTGRLIDHDRSSSMELKKRQGYF
ncbi:sulfate adenylyltransferase subunit CysD [Buchnera aphidicola]|uniref:sulfate adenylyltransferase subunit CysD n=1 Tax=Buchnera aphidicola TaxID=9 RepID=UPI0031B66ED5